MLWSIYEQHLEEAAFLWTQWEQALSAPDHVLAEVEPLEERLHSHVDGLVLGGEHIAKRLLLPALESDDLELIRTAALPLLLSDAPGCANEVLERIQSADGPTLAALQRALEVLESTRLPPWLLQLLRQEEPTLQALAIEVLGFHECAPAAACQALSTHESPRLASAALRAASRSRVALAPAVLERALAAPSPEVRDAAIEVGTIKGHHSAWVACRSAVHSRRLASPLPLLVLAVSGDERDLKLIQELLHDRTLLPDALWALGFSEASYLRGPLP
jgi:uncharacterized protein (TIGR02270 family)